MKRRALGLLCALALPAAVWLAPPLHPWTASFHDAYCLGSCCLVTDDFVEASCGEYPHP